MSNDLIALVVGITLGITVVVLGLRRNLGEVTQRWLPRWEAREPVVATPESSGGGQRRRELSPRQRQFAICTYLLISLGYAVLAVLGADGRLLHAITAALFAISAVVLKLKGRRLS